MSPDVKQDVSMILDETGLCARAAGLAPERVTELAAFARERGDSLIETLIARGQVDEVAFMRRLGELMKLPCITAEVETIDKAVLERISPSLAVGHEVVPIAETDGRLRAACWNPFDWRRWDELGHIVGAPLERVLCPRSVIKRMIKANYGLKTTNLRYLRAQPIFYLYF